MARNATATPEKVGTLRNHDEVVPWSDEQLLLQFLSRSGRSAEAAFTTLIERHGPIVYRVCLDILRGPDEAQDAAQAVFLVLAKKAGSIRKPGSLGPWLHGVALRVARRARSETTRRRTAERRKAELIHGRLTAESGPDFMDYSDLHEEIDRLPEKYRQLIILCYMQEQTQAQAAETLGLPLGTVQVRLHRGRERLRSRMMRQDTGLIGLTTSDLVRSLSVPAGTPGREWTETTARTAVRFAAGEGTAGLVTPVVTRMAEGVLATMFNGPLKIVALLAMILLLAAADLSLSKAWTDESHGTGKPTELRPMTASRDQSVKATNVTPREHPASLIVRNHQAEGQPVQNREKSDGQPIPMGPLQNSTNDQDIVPGSFTSPGQSPGLALVSRRLEVTPNKGLELFERNWVKNDPRGHGGDGLGPVFNGQSCVACHNLGGSGGAGGSDRNIEIATLTNQLNEGTGFSYGFSMDFGTGQFEYRLGNASGVPSRPGPRVDPRILAAIHPGFREARSVVLHYYGTDPAYNAWRGAVPGQHGSILVRTSERNPPPLFGAGLLDTIPDEAIEAAAKRKFSGSATVKGRVSRLQDGRIGRFGWKAQTATLKEFVLSAAAGELGLEVPTRRQAADPRLPGLGATGLDMDEAECNALSDYVRNLPAPIVIEPADDQESAQLKSGEETFKAIGCAQCHLPKLGDVEGIYSDLLLHDMSPRLGDAEAYSVFVGDPPRANQARASDRPGVASVREWRTPPLWGLRDSGPYLHDGRAESIDQAIALHAGQGTSSAKRHAALSLRRKQHLTAFLRSLAAPSANR